MSEDVGQRNLNGLIRLSIELEPDTVDIGVAFPSIQASKITDVKVLVNKLPRPEPAAAVEDRCIVLVNNVDIFRCSPILQQFGRHQPRAGTLP
jgi:hypothetical protein